MVSFSWLTSFSIIISKSIHVAADGIISFFSWLSSIPLCVCVCVYIHTTSSLSIYLSLNIGCLAIVNSASVNIGVYVSFKLQFCVMILFWYFFLFPFLYFYKKSGLKGGVKWRWKGACFRQHQRKKESLRERGILSCFTYFTFELSGSRENGLDQINPSWNVF